MPRASTRDRQRWIDGVEQYCDHESLEEIYSQGGEVLAVTCRKCGVRVVEIGDCDGCKKKRTKLTAFLLTGARPRRFCTQDCRQHTIQREKKKRAEAASVAQVKGRVR